MPISGAKQARSTGQKKKPESCLTPYTVNIGWVVNVSRRSQGRVGIARSFDFLGYNHLSGKTEEQAVLYPLGGQGGREGVEKVFATKTLSPEQEKILTKHDSSLENGEKTPTGNTHVCTHAHSHLKTNRCEKMQFHSCP